MKTRILNAQGETLQSAVDEAARILRGGGLVAFPTETVYGLGADAFNADAVVRVFRAKGRPADNPVIVHVGSTDELQKIASDLPATATMLAKKFWPGPLTLVVRHRNQLPVEVTAGLPTAALRMPDHPVALALIRAFGRGIVGPSANLSGKPSPTTAQHVLSDLDGLVDAILDSGRTRIGLESTVLDMTTSPPTILRPGGLPKEEIEEVVGAVSTGGGDDLLRRSPGTRHRHYAPRARLILIKRSDESGFEEKVNELLKEGKSVACIVHSFKPPEKIADDLAISMREGAYGHEMYGALRMLDDVGVDAIVVESVTEIGIGEAVMDRLRRAAGKI